MTARILSLPHGLLNRPWKHVEISEWYFHMSHGFRDVKPTMSNHRCTASPPPNLSDSWTKSAVYWIGPTAGITDIQNAQNVEILA